MKYQKTQTSRPVSLRRVAEHMTRHPSFTDFLYLGIVLIACLLSSIFWFDSVVGGPSGPMDAENISLPSNFLLP